MDKIFASKPGRKRFIFLISILLLLLLLVRFYMLPIESFSDKINETIISFLEKFITSVFTAVIVGYFLYWIIGDEKKKQLEFTESSYEIEKHLSNSRLKTERWLFNGGLGRYTKSDTIPKLSERASKERQTITVHLIVINPFNISLIQKYINFRVSVETPSKKAYWTELEVQSEILATIVTALFYKKQNQFLDISVKIKDFFTLSRMDISSSLAVITREDPAIPSIIVEKDSYLYRHYSEEFQQVYRQSKTLDYVFSGIGAPTKNEIQLCIQSLFPFESINSLLLEAVYSKFEKPKNPFA
ncbi:hypothetical protein ACQ33O_13290 [Ferruginibacter sp. SUN002]|uniref:hypothetical protein n=1 Tax=Ferruginibacter sp. SUN002 TaxID=2937789 RepID=UPI003D3619FD